MLTRTQAIVLHHFRYDDNSTIVQLYTREFGRLSIMLKGLGGKKNRHKLSVLSVLNLLDAEIEHKHNRQLQKLRNFVLSPMYDEIPFKTEKSAIALFLAEVLNKSIREEESNYFLFDFLKAQLIALDHISIGAANFHLYFLVKLTRFLGFVPQNNYSESLNVFHLRSGKFSSEGHTEHFILTVEESYLLHQLLTTDLTVLAEIRISRSLRRSFLEKWINYYQLHLEGFGEINSLKVLNELFS